MMFCRYCGHKLSEDEVFCAECGKKLDVEENKAAAPSHTQHIDSIQPNQPQALDKKSVGKKAKIPVFQMLAIVISLVALLISMFSLIVVMNNKSTTEQQNTSTLTVEEAKTIVSELITAGEKIERDIYASGLDYAVNDYIELGVGVSYYAVTDSDYQSIADIKAATEAVYTKSFAETNFYDAFEGVTPRYVEQNGKLYVLPGGIGSGSRDWKMDTLTIKVQSGNMVWIEMNLEDYGSIVTKQILLKKENGKYLLESSVF